MSRESGARGFGTGTKKAAAMTAEAAQAAGEKPRNRLAAVRLDEASISRGNPDQEHERAIAIYDILEDNSFTIPDRDDGPYASSSGWWRTSSPSRSRPRAASR